MHGWHQGGTGQERYAMSPASSLALCRNLCFLVEQCPVRKCANRRTWNWRQRAGGNLQLCVCKSNSHRSRPPKSCFSKRFWIGDWEGSVTAHILDMYGYGWEVGAFLYSFAWECVRDIGKRKWLISLHSPPALPKLLELERKVLDLINLSQTFLMQVTLQTSPGMSGILTFRALFLRCEANYWMTWVIPLHLALAAPDQHL